MAKGKASPRFAKATRYAYMLRDMGIKVHYRDVMRDGFITQEFSVFDSPYMGRRHVAAYLRTNHNIELGSPIKEDINE